MKNILFVDDDAAVLRALGRMLRTRSGEWHMTFAESGAKALEQLGASPVDIVVTDMRMPQMDGAALLAEVAAQIPGTVRVVLSGQADRASMVRAGLHAHRCIGKPCKGDMLQDTIADLISLQQRVADIGIRSSFLDANALPCLPLVCERLMRVLAGKDVSIDEVSAIISEDLGLSSKLLQLASWTQLGPAHLAPSPGQAVRCLGVEGIRQLVQSSTFGPATADVDVPELECISEGSQRAGAFAAAIARIQGADTNVIETCFSAGVLQNIGKLLIVGTRGNPYGEVPRKPVQCIEGISAPERDTSGVSHTDVGARLLELWGFPDEVVQAVEYHDRPTAVQTTGFSPLAAVHVGAALAGAHPDMQATQPHPHVDVEYLTAAGLIDCYPSWVAACQRVAA